MKRWAILGALALCIVAFAPAASAQSDTDTKNHGNFGVFFDFTRVQPAQLNLFGVGARLGVNVRKHVVIEGEAAYDFEREKTQVITVGAITSTVRSNLRLLNFLGWPQDPDYRSGQDLCAAERRYRELWGRRSGNGRSNK